VAFQPHTHNIGFGTFAKTTLDRRNGHIMFEGQAKPNHSAVRPPLLLYNIVVVYSLFDVCLLNVLITIFRAGDSHAT